MVHFLSALVAYPTMSLMRYGWAVVGFWISIGAVCQLQAQDRYTSVLTEYYSLVSSSISVPSDPTLSDGSVDATRSDVTRSDNPQRRNAPAKQQLKKSDRYFVLPPCPVNQYTSGEIIAVPKDQSPVLNATLKKGSTPAGTTLFPNGCLVVIDPAQLDVGTYRFAVETADQEGNTATHSLTVKLKPSGNEDTDAMYAVRQPKALDQYVRGDVLAASQDRDGAIVRSEFVKGALPTGASLTTDGRVVVDDPTQLQAGQYAAWIATEDERGGTTLFIITLLLQ